MMPQPMDHRLIHVLLPWIMILTISQVAFVTFYFTAGYHRSSGDNIAPEPTVPTTDTNTLHTKDGLNKVLSFHATSATANSLEKIKWKGMKEDSDLATANENLTIHQDGYYFLCLQVTVENIHGQEHTVRLKTKDKILLEGKINTNSSASTGLMGKVDILSAGDILVVTIRPAAKINTSSFKSHIGFIYLSEH